MVAACVGFGVWGTHWTLHGRRFAELRSRIGAALAKLNVLWSLLRKRDGGMLKKLRNANSVVVLRIMASNRKREKHAGEHAEQDTQTNHRSKAATGRAIFWLERTLCSGSAQSCWNRRDQVLA